MKASARSISTVSALNRWNSGRRYVCVRTSSMDSLKASTASFVTAKILLEARARASLGLGKQKSMAPRGSSRAGHKRKST
eukprot:3920125-Pyramimonas_sp.AAC.1